MFYDNKTSFIVGAYMESSKCFVTELNAYALKASLEYVKNVTKELMFRKIWPRRMI